MKKQPTAGRPRINNGDPNDKVKVVVEMPRSLRDEALVKSQEQDISLAQFVRMATRAFIDGRVTISSLLEK